MAKERPACQQLITWLRARHGAAMINRLSDEDVLTLHAQAHLMELHGRGDDHGRAAVRVVLPLLLQRFSAEHAVLAQEAIAQVLDWSDIPRLWPWKDGATLLAPPHGAAAPRPRSGPRPFLCTRPQCREGYKDLRESRYSLAPLTGQDRSALSTWMHVAALSAFGTPRPELDGALRALLPGMQATIRPLAESVRHVWGVRQPLSPITPSTNTPAPETL